MTTTTTGRARKRPSLLPSSPAISGELAARVLRSVIATGDHIGTANIGPGYSPSHFLLVEFSDHTFRQLCYFGAESEDMEDNGDDEPEDFAA